MKQSRGIARFRRVCVGALVALSAALLPTIQLQAASYTGTQTVPISNVSGSATWTSDPMVGAYVVTDNAAQCFDGTGRPLNPPHLAGADACEVFTLSVTVPAGFWTNHTGGVRFHSEEGLNDYDFYVFLKNVDGTKGALVTAQGAIGGTGGVEDFTIDKASGEYYVAAVAFLTAGPTTGTFTFFTGVSIPNAPPIVTNPPGFPTFRASHDVFTSHSEPHIAMNPLNHANLVAGSKMYVNNKHYLFRIGMYSSFDGGQTWSDAGHLPVPDCANSPDPCSSPANIDPTYCAGDPSRTAKPACFFTTSDIWLSFDDEGNVYAIVLVSPSSNTGSGWEMWMYKSSDGGRTWPLSSRRVIHDHFNKALSSAFLDDKDAIVVDNYTAAGTGLTTVPNSPRDGKIGNIYACWGLDGTVAPTQNQVVSTSTDGGNTWSVPFVVSGLSNVREIGCQLSVAPSGRVYVSFFVYGLTVNPPVGGYFTGVGQYLAWSDTHGAAFTVPIKVASVNPVPNHLQQADNFRNLSLPALAVSPKDGTVYVTWADENKYTGGQDADILMVKSTMTAGIPMFNTPPVKVNHDPLANGRDQFQPQIAVTQSGQINISYFDRRNDPSNFFIDTYLSRSDDGGASWRTDTRVTRAMSDPRINPPIDGAGNYFYGDYQGLVADDRCAMPFWQDTHLANLPTTDPNYSPWQEVFSARIPNGTASCPTGPVNGCHEADGNGEVNRTDATGANHRANFQFDKDACEDGQPESVSVQDPDSKTDFKSTQILSAVFDDVLHTITLSGTGLDNGLPVTFTMVAADGGVLLGKFMLTLSNGYLVNAPLISGVIQL
jgi:hypothetical protein